MSSRSFAPCIADDAGIRLRELAAQLGITERTAHRIVASLVASGYVTRERVGRRNRYEVCTEMPVRTPERDVQLRDLLSIASG